MMRIRVTNFRSIQDQEVEIAPITLIYGPNASGKSSLLYALPALRNIIMAPNQPTPAFFNFQVMSLGGFREVVFDHDEGSPVILGIGVKRKFQLGDIWIRYGVELKKNENGRFFLDLSMPGHSGQWGLPVAFPYAGNQQTELEIEVGDQKFTVTWTGLTCGVAQPTPEVQRLVEILNAPVETLRQVTFVPHRRGFFQPQYAMTQASPSLLQDTEIASLLAGDPYLEGQVGFYLEKIVSRQFRVRPQIGTGLFTLLTQDRETGMLTELVNDGFGVNQLVYLLAKVLHPETKIACIEEPEIHLHPSAIRRLARQLAKITQEKEKYLLITTHSESLVVAFLALVARGELSPKELACYLAVKEGKVTRFERQEVNEKGQVEGGLQSFMEGELEDIRAFLGVQEKE